MANICMLLTTGPERATIESVGPDPDTYEVCLMLTRIFLGREDSGTAGNLYLISRLFKPNRAQEEGKQDGYNRSEA